MDLPVEQTWLILVNLLTDLKKKGIDIPNSINRDISLVKTSINFYKKDTSHPDMIKEFDRANMAITEIQDHLLEFAEDFSDDYYKKWIDKLKRANLGEEVYSMPKTNSRFVVGSPPGFSKSRISFKKPIAEERIQEIAEYNNIILEMEADNIVVVYGDMENMKKGVKELGSFFLED
ncbi:MAG: DUF2096 domain-containing protein [Methanobacteriaceae archaeon]